MRGAGEWKGMPGLVARLLSYTSVRVLGLFWLLVALVATQLPLLHSLGYEFAVLMGVLVAWTGGPVFLTLARRLRRLPAVSALRGVLRDWWALASLGLLLLFPPAAVMVVAMTFIRNCAPLEGGALYLLIPGAGALFIAAVVVLLSTAFRRRPGWVLFALLLALLAQPFVEILTQPQLYAYNHVFGMFVGLSWDQLPPPLGTLLLFRGLTFSFVVMMLAVTAALRTLARPSRGSTRIALAFVFVLGLLPGALLLRQADALGFRNSEAHLRTVLHATLRTEHFDIHYDPASVAAGDLAFIADEHEFQFSEVRAALNIRYSRRITSWLYPDDETKGRLFGTVTSEVARPWLAEMHIGIDAIEASLRHELVHVMAAEFGPHYIGVPFLRVLGLTEGLAMAVEWRSGERSLHEQSAAMLHYGLLPPVSSFIGTAGFLGGASSVGYVSSGSFTRWLMDSRGVEAVKRCYAADDIEGTLGTTYARLEEEWHAWLRTVERRTPDSVATLNLFRAPSLFTTMCARAVGDMGRRASTLLRRGNAVEALAVYGEIERQAPGARAAYGIMQSLYQLARHDSVIAFTTRLLTDTNRAYTIFPMVLWRGAAFWALGDTARAAADFSALLHERPAGWTPGRAQRLLTLLRAYPRDDTVRELALRGLRVSTNPDSTVLAHAREAERLAARCVPADPLLDEAIVRYASVDSTRGHALTLLRAVPEERRSCAQWKLLGMLAYRRGDLDTAERSFAIAQSRCLAGEDDISTWVRRCAWKRAQRDAAANIARPRG